ncbi:hypothetical protein GJ744_008813 [Endocarpon pusillum]|uniref:Uncharacterized protein n=1 Tax=Endocarpon pusillum TaxID=364733 RepID=A0A8H7E7P9_9EURO|nr:hypothetical protein GJ744_008813 [Endocarpon pusillum]
MALGFILDALYVLVHGSDGDRTHWDNFQRWKVALLYLPSFGSLSPYQLCPYLSAPATSTPSPKSANKKSKADTVKKPLADPRTPTDIHHVTEKYIKYDRFLHGALTIPEYNRRNFKFDDYNDCPLTARSCRRSHTATRG